MVLIRYERRSEKGRDDALWSTDGLCVGTVIHFVVSIFGRHAVVDRAGSDDFHQSSLGVILISYRFPSHGMAGPEQTKN